MQYIIDGYNLIFRVFKEKRPLQKKRESIISFLSDQVSNIKASITVVFDSVNVDEESRRGHKGPIEIIYTAKKQTADEYILDEIATCKNPKQKTVVTSDRTLANHCKTLGAHAQSIESFLEWLESKQKSKIKKSIKPRAFKDTESNIKRLLEIFEKKLKDEIEE